MAETRTRRRIREAVESRGYELVELEWEPWGMAMEMSGIPGGWYGRLERPYVQHAHPGDEIMGLSVDETIAWVDQFVKPPEPCDCDRPQFYSPMNPLKDQRHLRGMHDEGCRWALDYRLRRWTDEHGKAE